MGYLEAGATPLTWEQSTDIKDRIREYGTIQFLNLYNKYKDYANDSLLWGEEMEYHIIYQPPGASPKLYVKSAEKALKILSEAENLIGGSLIWHLEYGAWMIECVPKDPYTDYLEDLLTVEAKLGLSRKKMVTVLQAVEPNTFPISLPCFPLLGIGDYFYPRESEEINSSISSSLYIDNSIITPHPRFPTLTRNIVARRRRPLEMYAPLFYDEYTQPFDEPRPGFIHMDASGFGMGMCCLQTTMNTTNINEARYLHDQYIPLCPIMLALSACTPFFKGKLSDLDTRWEVLSQSMDDRTTEEVESGITSRYGPSELYISQCQTNKCEYNDVDVHIHQPTFDFFVQNGVDNLLAKHLALIFSRDPLVIFPDKIEVDHSLNTNHFENFQSTNWNSVRFKPPPSMDSTIGWRVEFRSMDIQLTDFENAAYSIFIVLLSRMVLSLNLNFQIPMSKVHENYTKASLKDAVLNQKFWFKLNIVPMNCKNFKFSELRSGNCKDKLEELTVKEIICGTGEYLGLLGYIDKYLLEVVGCSAERYTQISRYLNFIRKRANGELPTGASYLRKLIRSHPDYAKDSLITPSIASDIINAAKDDYWNEELLGPYTSSA
jgi:glutamate--cysteine ligase catalytic subunit